MTGTQTAHEDYRLMGVKLRGIFRELFPDIESDREVHAMVNDILQTVDKDRSGTIDFGEYLHMMRVYNDIAQKELEEEQRE